MIDGAVRRNYLLMGAALFMSVLPLPQMMLVWQPPWLAVALIWAVIAAPGGLRFVAAAVAGLLQDLLVGAPLGLHALAATLLVFMAANMRHWVISSPPWMRFLLAMALLIAYVGVLAMIGGWFDYPGSWGRTGASLASGAVLILVAFLFLRV